MTLENLEFIKVRGATQHNLKNINVNIPKNKLTVITGLSGSGKSSLAFDTIYAEGQRRYVESLTVYARQFLNLQNKPNVESIQGIVPAIAIDQKTVSKNPRSTVSTITEIYDYLRLLYARAGIPHSPATGLPIENQSSNQMMEQISSLPEGTQIALLAPIVNSLKGEFRKDLLTAKKQGYQKIRIDGIIYDITNSLPKLNKNKTHNIEIVVDKITLTNDIHNRLSYLIETALKISDGILIVEIKGLPKNVNVVKLKKKEFKIGEIIRFSEKFTCPVSGLVIDKIEPRLFSFNSPFGACKKCDGLGTELDFDPALVVPNESLSIKKGAVEPWSFDAKGRYYMQILESIGKKKGFTLDQPFNTLSKEIQNLILYGTDEEFDIKYDDGYRLIETKSNFLGAINILEKKWNNARNEQIQDELMKYQSLKKCSQCGGHRLNEQALSVLVAEKNIGEICTMPITTAIKFFENINSKLNSTQQQIAEKAVEEIIKRLGFLRNVGLGYLTLSRESGSLSGGESQRIRLASQIGSGLTGVLYVLDEPSIGLHQSDNSKLIKTLKDLRDLGNTVIVVEHDEETMKTADYLIDIGPGAGLHGGEIISQGLPKQVINDIRSITGQYLKGTKSIEVPKKRRKINPKKMITIKNARAHNLKNIDVSIPVGIFCAVTGVSGGGKSSLILHTMYKALSRVLSGSKIKPGAHDKIEGVLNVDKIIQIDQSPIGRTPRSNPCTYVGAFTGIRDLFVSLPESRVRGYKLGRFSFNVKGGRCENCQGDGMIKIEMHFLPDVYVKCNVCDGKRYNKETLEIKHKGKSISDILQLNVDEACEFFKDMPHINDKFLALRDVGLGYIGLGQSATTLSGGEAQRIKLAKELSKKDTGNTVYILDEPTTGLHSEDIKKLLKVLHKLVDQGNTIIVIEHNLDVIKTSDWIIDMGPEGGDKGGYIVAEGTPEDILKNPKSITAEYLKKVLK
ncbi:excinuclease ABC subunit UvrA [Pseudomonadota bacterium]